MTTQPIVFEDTTLYPVFDPVFDFLLTNREVAKGFGTSIQNIIVAKNRNSDELIEGKHYLRLDTQTNGGVQKGTLFKHIALVAGRAIPTITNLKFGLEPADRIKNFYYK